MQNFRIKFRFLLPLFLLLFMPTMAAAQQDDQTAAETAQQLLNGKTVALDKLQWKYRAGDDARWAAGDFGDDDWQTLFPTTK